MFRSKVRFSYARILNEFQINFAYEFRVKAMTMRRNIISLFIWVTIVAIFAIHVIISRKKNDIKTISERSITEVKTTILERTESENIEKVKNNPMKDVVLKTETTKGMYSRELNDEDKDLVGLKNTVNFTITTTTSKLLRHGDANLHEENLKTEIIKLKNENNRYKLSYNLLMQKEKQLKNLARRLASKLKGKEGGLLPKLDPSLPWIFAITPTYSRYTQKADLIRLSQTLMHVTNLHWVIVEDSSYRTDLVSKLLVESGLSFTHLNIQTPPHMKRRRGEKYNKHHRGVLQRNLAMKWIRENVNIAKTPGVVYFMDDDNTYHRKLFDEMRKVHHLGVWPVALAGGLRFAGPKCAKGKVTGFHVKWGADRSFPIDMAGFAINLRLLIKEKPEVIFESTAKRGYLEPTFLEQLTTLDQLEPMANNCTKVLVWHTRTESPKESLKGEKEMIKMGRPSDPSIET